MISENIKQLQQHKRDLQAQIATMTNTVLMVIHVNLNQC